jgi:L,D-transpeptidase YcbB
MNYEIPYNKQLIKPLWFHCIILLILIAGCQRKLTTTSSTFLDQPLEAKAVVVPARVPNNDNDSVYQHLRYRNPVFALYAKRSFEPLWLEKKVLSENGKSMIGMIGSARRYGLLPQEYHAYEILKVTQTPDQNEMLRLEVLLTDAYFSMANDLRYGRLNRKASLQSDSLKLTNLVDSLAEFDLRSILEAQEPQFNEYQSLKVALNSVLDSIAPDEKTLLFKGITNHRSEVHRTVQVIELNLERWRAESASLNGTYAWVNVPAYMFYVIEDGSVVLQSRVVVGKRSNETPRFSSLIECFTVFPYWYVPRKITLQEYLPVLKKDTTFLTRNNFDVLDRSGKIQDATSIDWKKLSPNDFPYTLRQREGKENSLGILKFVFDNPYAVFVHDTNAKRLFNNKMRALSHGCIRLEKAYEFAHYLIDGRSTITKQTLDNYLKTEKKATVNLTPSVPIHVRYYTCEVREERLVIYDDIYQLDKKAIATLYGQGNLIEN